MKFTITLLSVITLLAFIRANVSDTTTLPTPPAAHVTSSSGNKKRSFKHVNKHRKPVANAIHRRSNILQEQSKYSGFDDNKYNNQDDEDNSFNTQKYYGSALDETATNKFRQVPSRQLPRQIRRQVPRRRVQRVAANRRNNQNQERASRPAASAVKTRRNDRRRVDRSGSGSDYISGDKENVSPFLKEMQFKRSAYQPKRERAPIMDVNEDKPYSLRSLNKNNNRPSVVKKTPQSTGKKIVQTVSNDDQSSQPSKRAKFTQENSQKTIKVDGSSKKNEEESILSKYLVQKICPCIHQISVAEAAHYLLPSGSTKTVNKLCWDCPAQKQKQEQAKKTTTAATSSISNDNVADFDAEIAELE